MSSSYQVSNPYLEALLIRRSRDSQNWEQFATTLDRVLSLFEAGVWQSSRADEVCRRLMELRTRMQSTTVQVMGAYDQAINYQPPTVGVDDPRIQWRMRF